MFYFVLLLFVFLFFLLGGYTFVTLKRVKISKKSVIEDVNRFSKLDLNKWRGGVRFPAGYYKSTEEFYQIEKDLKYHK